MSSYGIKRKDIEADEKVDVEYDPAADDPNADKPSTSKGGRPKSDFDKIGMKGQRKRLKPTLEKVKNDAKENKITNTKMVAKLGQMIANEEGDKQKADMFAKIANEQNPLAHREMDVAKATAIKVH